MGQPDITEVLKLAACVSSKTSERHCQVMVRFTTGAAQQKWCIRKMKHSVLMMQLVRLQWFGTTILKRLYSMRLLTIRSRSDCESVITTGITNTQITLDEGLRCSDSLKFEQFKCCLTCMQRKNNTVGNVSLNLEAKTKHNPGGGILCMHTHLCVHVCSCICAHTCVILTQEENHQWWWCHIQCTTVRLCDQNTKSRTAHYTQKITEGFQNLQIAPSSHQPLFAQISNGKGRAAKFRLN